METVIVTVTALAIALGLLCLNAWLLMWAWNFIAAWFTLPLINWNVALAGLIVAGCFKGAFAMPPRKES